VICSDCSRPITRQSKTGRCRSCAARRCGSDPVMVARRSEALRRRMRDDPAFRARRARELHCRNLSARKDPAVAARFLEIIRENRKGLNKPGVRERWLAGRKEAGRKRHETVMAWCPPEYRAEYKRLRQSKKMLAAEAKRIILAQLTPFERKMQAVRTGAGISAKPVLRASDHSYSLIGNSSQLAAGAPG